MAQNAFPAAPLGGLSLTAIQLLTMVHVDGRSFLILSHQNMGVYAPIHPFTIQGMKVSGTISCFSALNI